MTTDYLRSRSFVYRNRVSAHRLRNTETQEKITDSHFWIFYTHKNPKFGRVRQIPIRELGWEFPDWGLSHFAKFGTFVGIL